MAVARRPRRRTPTVGRSFHEQRRTRPAPDETTAPSSDEDTTPDTDKDAS
ncbi:hypothetical protein K5X85_36060 [Streptomyces sp. A144]|nr:hypothetical protein [Streptomyces sp. A144]